MDNQKVLDALNSMEEIESSGGEEAYILVANNEENQEILKSVGIPLEKALQYGDDETFCILALAFGEGYCDLYSKGNLIKFDASTEFEFNGTTYIFARYDGELHFIVSEDGGTVEGITLSKEQIAGLSKLLG